MVQSSKWNGEVAWHETQIIYEELKTRAAYSLVVDAPGYARGGIEKVIAHPLDNKGWPLEIALERGTRITTELKAAATGAPVSGARVHYLGKAAWPTVSVHFDMLDDLGKLGSQFNKVMSTMSGEDGKVAMNLAGKPLAITVLVIALGYAPQLMQAQSAEHGSIVVPALQREATIRGIVKGFTGEKSEDPQRYISITAADFHRSFVGLRADGTFESNGLPPGKIRVQLAFSWPVDVPIDHDAISRWPQTEAQLVSGEITSVVLQDE